MSRRLLLVDDSRLIREIAQISLERLGEWTVLAVPSGQAALAAVEGGEAFDAVVLDVMMPQWILGG